LLQSGLFARVYLVCLSQRDVQELPRVALV